MHILLLIAGIALAGFLVFHKRDGILVRAPSRCEIKPKPSRDSMSVLETDDGRLVPGE